MTHLKKQCDKLSHLGRDQSRRNGLKQYRKRVEALKTVIKLPYNDSNNGLGLSKLICQITISGNFRTAL